MTTENRKSSCWKFYIGAASLWVATFLISGVAFSQLSNFSLWKNPSGLTTGSWQPTSVTGVPMERELHTVVWTGSKMIVWGGDSTFPNLYLNTGGLYDPTLDSWSVTSTGTNTPLGRDRHTAIWTGSKMVIWGGYNGTYLGSGAQYDPVADTWSATFSDAPPSPRGTATSVWTGSKMMMWGGYDGTNYLNSGGIYNPTTDSWEQMQMNGSVPAGRTYATSVWTGSKMIIWGGYISGSTYQNTGGVYDPVAGSWTATSTGANTPSARYRHSLIWTGSKMIVWGGGGTNTNTNTGGIYDPSTDTWTATSVGANVPDARQAHTVIWTGSKMIVWGGYISGTTTYFNTGGIYDPSTDTWSATSVGANVPLARYSHTAVWTGAKMIVWGGYTPSVSNTGGQYDPSTDTWSATSVGTNVPPARQSHTAVWTGSKMIVWGGTASSLAIQLNSGGVYDPVADSWTATSVGTNVPSYRTGHVALWTGSAMVVWGGYKVIPTTYYNNGGQYDPSTDTWTSTSVGTISPEARRSHSAIWTGSKMIVWSGFNGTSYVATGGLYNPTTDTWTATSTGANVPAGRTVHSAIWTGSKMIVWGGFSGSYVNTGGQYDPVADTWTATSVGANVPTGRNGQSAVWTGSKMIIWGGYAGGSIYYNSGGQYDPVADTWTVTSTGNTTPAARRSHSAVWTGSKMIIWGGFAGGSTSYNNGGLYDPTTDIWIATDTGANTPAARYNHGAVWTGSKMIIWGGTNSTYVNTGGVFTP